jgi:hypothetical protein
MDQDRTVGESRQGVKREGNNEWNRTGLWERADREGRERGIMNGTGQDCGREQTGREERAGIMNGTGQDCRGEQTGR